MYEMTEGELTPEESKLVEQFRKIKSDDLRTAAANYIAQLAKADQGSKGKK